MANETITEMSQVDPMGMLFSMLVSGPALIFYGILIGAIIVVLFYVFVYKKQDHDVFEYEKFEDTVMNDLKKKFTTEGINSKAKLTHGMNNPLGTVDKWMNHKGEWIAQEYDPSTRSYKDKTDSTKVQKKDVNGKPIVDKKGKPVYDKSTQPLKIKYDLKILRVKGQGFFQEPQYVIADSQNITYNPKLNSWNIDPVASLSHFGKAWITGKKGELFVQDISFRRSLENNMTFLQNQSRKVIFLETAFAQRHELKIGSGIAKKLSYDQYAKKVLKDAGDMDDEDET